MAQQVCVVLSTAEREQLAAIVADRNRPRKHVERAGIVLASADRHSAQQVAQRIGVSRPTVWRWQQRFAESGIEGLLRDKTRKPGKAPIAAEITARVVALTCTAPPHQATHWTGRAMAKAIGISVGSVQRVWRAHKLQPHRLRTFKRSRDPSFAAKLTDIVGLYLDPPAHAVVLSIDEKSQGSVLPCALRRAVAARSAIWKKGRRAWTQHAASTIRPGLRSVSYSLLYPPKASAWKIPASSASCA
jgi:transposase